MSHNNSLTSQPYTRSTSRISPSCIFLTVTLLVTASATSLLTLSIMNDHWEYIDFDMERVKMIAKMSNTTVAVKMILDDRVAQLNITATIGAHTRRRRPAIINLVNSNPAIIAFLVPMYGGVWSICTDLNEKQRAELAHIGYNHSYCQKYLSVEMMSEGPNDWMTRMQNLSISCAMVSLIILGTSALLGLFGILKRQISAVLVTGVMYILAAVFCIFTLGIMHFKRKTSKDCGLVDRLVPEEFQHAQIISTGWSLGMGWVGVTVCTFAAILWCLLSKIMRYGPITLT